MLHLYVFQCPNALDGISYQHLLKEARFGHTEAVKPFILNSKVPTPFPLEESLKKTWGWSMESLKSLCRKVDKMHQGRAWKLVTRRCVCRWLDFQRKLPQPVAFKVTLVLESSICLTTQNTMRDARASVRTEKLGQMTGVPKHAEVWSYARKHCKSSSVVWDERRIHPTAPVWCLLWLSGNHGRRCQPDKNPCKGVCVIDRQKTQHICKLATWRTWVDAGAGNKAFSNVGRLVYVGYVMHYWLGLGEPPSC